MPYTGFLYAGLMIDKAGDPRSLEFNCRLGDPETQPIMLRLKSDLLELIEHALDGTLDQARGRLGPPRRARRGARARTAIPDAPRKGDAINGLARRRRDDCRVFHAGTALDGKTRRHQRRPRALRHRARRLGAHRAQRAPTRWSTASASTACSTATTSATAR